MKKSPIDDLLPNIPKRAPVWSIGITTILIALASCLITIYLVSKEDINSAIGWAEKHHEVQTQARITEEAAVLDNVMKLLNIKSQQILELSKAVATTQQNNFLLMQRVDNLEKDIQELKVSLEDCHVKLMACEKSKKCL